MLKTRFLAAALFMSPLAAQPLTAESETGDSYTRLAEAVASDKISKLIFERDMEAGFKETLAQDPEVAVTETDCPGFVDGFAKALRPIMLESHNLDYAWYRSKLIETFRAGMSAEQAGNAATFFASEPAQIFLSTAITNYSLDNTVSDVMTNDDMSVSAEALEADKRATAALTMRKMDKDDLNAFITGMAQSEWFPAFRKMQPTIQSLNLEMANRDFTPEHQIEFDRVAEDYATSALDACYGPE